MKKILPLLLVVLMISCTSLMNAEIVKILIQGDSQKIMNPVNGEQDNFVPFMAKTLTDPITGDADFILQMGDIVESDSDNSDRPQQYVVAREGWRQLDGKIPYVLNLGNNDAAGEYLAAFDDLNTPLYSNNGGKNFAYTFNAGNIDWLVISLRFGSKRAEHDWMEELIKMHPDKKVILIKHEVNVNSAVVNRLKRHSNVVLVLSGHTQSQQALLVGNNGNKIGWIRTCHHDEYLDSYFRVLLIDTFRGTVSSSFYSPQYEKFWHDPTAPYHDCDRSTPWTFEGFNFGMSESSSARKGNNAEFVSLNDVPCCIVAGETFKAVAVVENTGTNKWDADLQANKYKLSSENPKDNSTWVAKKKRSSVSENRIPREGYRLTVSSRVSLQERLFQLKLRLLRLIMYRLGLEYPEDNGTAESETNQTFLSEDVMPGERHRFEINSKAPAREGFYNFQLRMVQEGVQRFGTFSENRIVYVAPNKVVNSSFEDDEPRSESWSLGSGASWTNKNKRSGDSALCITGVSTATSQTVALEKNTDYNISVWYNNGNATSGKVVFDTKDVFDRPGEGQFVIVPGEADGWTQFAGSFNSGELDSITIRMFAKELVGTVYFDDVAINPKAQGDTDFAYRNVEYSCEIDVTDLNNDSLEYSCESKPEWLDFDSETGILRGTPSDKDIGTHAVTLYAKDAEKEEISTFTVRVLEASPLAKWQEIHSTYGEMMENDKDLDGLTDFLEFALGGDPNKNDATNILPKILPNESGFNFTFRRNQATLTYIVQESVNSTDWYDYTVVDDSNGFVGDTCVVPLPLSNEEKSFRLEVRR